MQANAQHCKFPILHFHLTQVQETNMLILLDRRAKEKSIEKRNSELFWFHSLRANHRIKGFGNGKKVYIMWSWFHRELEWNGSQQSPSAHLHFTDEETSIYRDPFNSMCNQKQSSVSWHIPLSHLALVTLHTELCYGKKLLITLWQDLIFLPQNTSEHKTNRLKSTVQSQPNPTRNTFPHRWLPRLLINTPKMMQKKKFTSSSIIFHLWSLLTKEAIQIAKVERCFQRKSLKISQKYLSDFWHWINISLTKVLVNNQHIDSVLSYQLFSRNKNRLDIYEITQTNKERIDKTRTKPNPVKILQGVLMTLSFTFFKKSVSVLAEETYPGTCPN